MKKENLAIIFSLITHIIFGLSFPFSKIALEYSSPITLLALRFLLAFVVLNLILFSGKAKLNYKGKNLKGLLLMGIFQPILYFLCEMFGIQFTTVTFSSVMIALIPIVSLFLEAIFFKFKTNLFQVFCAILSISGVIMMTMLNASDGIITVGGVILLIGAVLTAVGYSFTSRITSSDFSAFERTYFMFMLGATFYSILAIFENGENTYQAFIAPWSSSSFVVCILFLGVLSSVVAFYGMNYAYSNAPVSKVAIFANIVPVVSTAVGVVFLDEPFSMLHFISIVVILVGLIGFQKAQDIFKKRQND